MMYKQQYRVHLLPSLSMQTVAVVWMWVLLSMAAVVRLQGYMLPCTTTTCTSTITSSVLQQQLEQRQHRLSPRILSSSFSKSRIFFTVSPPHTTATTVSTALQWMPRHHCRRSTSRLYLDVFGLGPSEVLLIVFGGLVLFGPERLKGQFQGSKSLQELERDKLPPAVKDLYDRMDYAEQVRYQRALRFLNEAMEDNDEYVLKKVEEFVESKKPNDVDDDDDDDQDFDKDLTEEQREEEEVEVL